MHAHTYISLELSKTVLSFFYGSVCCWWGTGMFRINVVAFSYVASGFILTQNYGWCVSRCYISSLVWYFLPVTFCSPVILPFTCFVLFCLLVRSWKETWFANLKVKEGPEQRVYFYRKILYVICGLDEGIQNYRLGTVIRPAWKKFGYRDRSLRNNFDLANSILSLQIFMS